MIELKRLAAWRDAREIVHQFRVMVGGLVRVKLFAS
jgi:hypothetical protein